VAESPSDPVSNSDQKSRYAGKSGMQSRYAAKSYIPVAHLSAVIFQVHISLLLCSSITPLCYYVPGSHLSVIC